MSRRIIVYIATSADGFIARPDGGIDWLDRPKPSNDYGLGKFMRSIDTVLWGRKTYDQAQGFTGGAATKDFGNGTKHYIFSARPGEAAQHVEWVTEPVDTFARRLRAQKGKDIWIDEFMIHVIPTMIGEGIPLVAARHRNVPLRLKAARKYPDGVVLLHYEVSGPSRRTGAKAAGKHPRRVRT